MIFKQRMSCRQIIILKMASLVRTAYKPNFDGKFNFTAFIIYYVKKEHIKIYV